MFASNFFEFQNAASEPSAVGSFSAETLLAARPHFYKARAERGLDVFGQKQGVLGGSRGEFEKRPFKMTGQLEHSVKVSQSSCVVDAALPKFCG
jgi:hypothetical protein